MDDNEAIRRKNDPMNPKYQVPESGDEKALRDRVTRHMLNIPQQIRKNMEHFRNTPLPDLEGFKIPLQRITTFDPNTGRYELSEEVQEKLDKAQNRHIAWLSSPIEVTEVDDAVHHPSHYNQYKGWEVIDVCRQLRSPDGDGGYFRGNVFKYLARAGWKVPKDASEADKVAKEIEDLEKAQTYLEWEIQRLYTKLEELNDEGH